MAIDIIINGTTISFPSSAASPNWSPAIDQFAQVVAEALSGITNAGDIAPQSVVIDSSNPGTNVDVSGLSFSTSIVRSAIISYYCSRSTSTDNATESGTIQINYDASRAVNQKWAISRDKTGDGKVDFTITDTGQVQFTTTAMAGINHAGRIGFSAKALLQT